MKTGKSGNANLGPATNTKVSIRKPVLNVAMIQLGSGNLLCYTIFLQSCRSYLVEVNNQFN